MLPTIGKDIIGMDYDWLILPTTANEIIDIKKPNLHKIPISFPSTSKKVYTVPE